MLLVDHSMVQDQMLLDMMTYYKHQLGLWLVLEEALNIMETGGL